MPRKVFISFLGTTPYQECEYVKDDFSCRTRFIQEATFRYLSEQAQWTEQDLILILLTEDAEKRNWLDDGQLDRETHEVMAAPGLQRVLAGCGFASPIETIRHLPDGKDEKEMFCVFEAIFNAIREGDELYFDLTHAFRYFPMLILVLGNYAKFLKGVTVKSISYGNWEMSDKGKKPAPIIDLLSLSALQDWTFAAGQFIESGNAKQLIRLSQDEYKPVLMATKGDDLNARQLQSFTTSLEKVITERRTCRGLDIVSGKNIARLKETYRGLSLGYANPYMPLFDRISDTWSEFSGQSDAMNGIRAAEWCYNKGLFLQAATLLEETVLYYFSLRFGLDPLSRDDQGRLTGAFAFASKKLANHDTDSLPDDSKYLGAIILRDYPDIVEPFRTLCENIRNDFNHAGIRKNPWKSGTIVSRLKDLLDTISGILLKDRASITPTPSRRVILNISNHPSREWDEIQRQEATGFGEIIDIPFPDVPPSMTEDEINALAEQISKGILLKYPAPATVHIMGEMTLTFSLVTELKALGYNCIASTTRRNVSIDANGDKVVHFEFVRFRDY